MIFKNTFKLVFTNFSLTYKVLIYKLIVLLLALGVAGSIGTPFILYLKDINFFDFLSTNTINLFNNFNLGNFFIVLQQTFFKIIEIFSVINNELFLNAILSFSAFGLIYGFIGDLSELAVLDCINANLSSKTKLSFFKSLVAKSFKSLGKSLIKFILSIPYIIIMSLIFYYGFNYFSILDGVFKTIIPAIMFLLIVLFTGLHLSLVSGFGASIVINDEGLLKDLFTSFRTIRKKYLRLLSTSIMIVFVLTFCNILVAIYSFFAGLIFSLPITYLVISIFKVVLYYESNGMRYYVGDTIRSPLRKEKLDDINKIKYIV